MQHRIFSQKKRGQGTVEYAGALVIAALGVSLLVQNAGDGIAQGYLNVLNEAYDLLLTLASF